MMSDSIEILANNNGENEQMKHNGDYDCSSCGESLSIIMGTKICGSCGVREGYFDNWYEGYINDYTETMSEAEIDEYLDEVSKGIHDEQLPFTTRHIVEFKHYALNRYKTFKLEMNGG